MYPSEYTPEEATEFAEWHVECKRRIALVCLLEFKLLRLGVGDARCRSRFENVSSQRSHFSCKAKPLSSRT
jgi:hypothetical protein